MNNPVEVTEQLELLEKEKEARGLIGERMRQPIVLDDDGGDEDAAIDAIVGDAHAVGRQVVLVPPDGRMLYRPIDLVWFRADPPPLELSVVARPRKRFEEVEEDRQCVWSSLSFFLLFLLFWSSRCRRRRRRPLPPPLHAPCLCVTVRAAPSVLLRSLVLTLPTLRPLRMCPSFPPSSFRSSFLSHFVTTECSFR